MPQQSKTMVLAAPRTFEIVDRSLPAPAQGEALVRIAATAICHTDLDMYTGGPKNLRYPIVMGHESTGVVAALGSETPHLAPGQPVIINPVITCGHCDCCQRGWEHLCRNAGLFGREVEGSLCEYVRIPTRYLYPLPANMPLDAATLIETLATVHHAQRRAQLTAGESVVVFGQGATGLLHTRLAVLTGCKPVIAVSRSRWKLDRAIAMGAHEAVMANVEEAAPEVIRLTQGLGAEVVIDTAGGAATLKAGIDMLRPGGRFCTFSLSHEPVTGVSAFPLYYKEVSIVGSRALTAADIEASIPLVARGDIDVRGFVSTTFPLAAAPEAFTTYEADPNRYLRIVIDSRAA
jgi:2-desacetyl-2-hydroxyethyl bacteriochlorophyllide A dehydrogenase